MRIAWIIILVFLYFPSKAQKIENKTAFYGSSGGAYIKNILKCNSMIALWFDASADTIFQNTTPSLFRSTTMPSTPFFDPNHAYFAVYDTLGNLNINLQFTSSDNIYALDAKQTSDDNYLLTYLVHTDSIYINDNLIVADSMLKNGALCLSKVSANGNIIFTRCFPVDGGIGTAFIGELQDGAIVISGHVYHNVEFDSFVLPCIGCQVEDADIYVAVLDINGHTLNAKRFGGTEYDFLWDMEISPENDILMTGNFYSKDFFCEPFHLTNHMPSVSADAFLVKMNEELEPIWIKQLSSVHSEKGKCLSFDQEGSIFWGSEFCCSQVSIDGDTLLGGITNSIISKLTSEGHIVWNKVFPSGNLQYLYDISSSEDGTLWIALQFQDSLLVDNTTILSCGNYDAALIQLSTDGNTLRYFKIGASGWEKISSVQPINDHQVFVSGNASLSDSDSLKFLNLTLKNWPGHSGPDFYFVLDISALSTKTPTENANPDLLTPNPVRKNRSFFVNTLAPITGEIEIVDASGRTIWKSKVPEGSRLIEVPAPHQPGYFFLHFWTNKGNNTLKFIVID